MTQSETTQTLLMRLLYLAGGLIVGYLSLLVSDLGKPHVVITSDHVDARSTSIVRRDGKDVVIFVFQFYLINKSPFPGYVKNAKVTELASVPKGHSLVVKYFDGRKLWFLKKDKIEIRLESATPFSYNANQIKGIPYRLQLYDNHGQQVGGPVFSFVVGGQPQDSVSDHE